MKGYKAIFSCDSAINEMPNSQTLFGAISSIILDTKGQDEFDRYINSFKENNPLFVHSSMFQNDIYPMIKKNIFSSETVNEMVQKSLAIDKLKILESLKKYKHIKYMSKEIYQEYVCNFKINKLRNDLVNHSESFSIDNSILSKSHKDSNSISRLLTRNGFPESGIDKTLFYTNAIYYPKDTEFCIYLKSNVSSEYLESIFKYISYFGIGNRRSVGFNNFVFKRIEDTLFNNNDYCMILSRLIPNKDEFDFEQSYYQMSCDVYRSSKNYSGGKLNGNYTHLLEGSWMKTMEIKDYYGRVVETKINDKSIYHYGIGFSV